MPFTYTFSKLFNKARAQMASRSSRGMFGCNFFDWLLLSNGAISNLSFFSLKMPVKGHVTNSRPFTQEWEKCTLANQVCLKEKWPVRLSARKILFLYILRVMKRKTWLKLLTIIFSDLYADPAEPGWESSMEQIWHSKYVSFSRSRTKPERF